VVQRDLCASTAQVNSGVSRAAFISTFFALLSIVHRIEASYTPARESIPVSVHPPPL